MNKKLVLSLSSMTLALAPVMMVVACGDDKPAEISADQKALNEFNAALVLTANTATAGEATEYDVMSVLSSYEAQDITVDHLTELGITSNIAAAAAEGKVVVPAGTTFTAVIVRGTQAAAGAKQTYTFKLTAKKGTATVTKEVALTSKNNVAANNGDADAYKVAQATAGYIIFTKEILKAPTSGRVLSDAEDITDGVFKFEVAFTMSAANTTKIMTLAGFTPKTSGTDAEKQAVYDAYATAVTELAETALRAEVVTPAYNHISVGTYSVGSATVDSIIKAGFEFAVATEADMNAAVAELNKATPTPNATGAAKIAQDLKTRAIASLTALQTSAE